MNDQLILHIKDLKNQSGVSARQKVGSKAGDGGQSFTPREIIGALVKIIDPKICDMVYDPSCGTGGFLAQGRPHARRGRRKDQVGP